MSPSGDSKFEVTSSNIVEQVDCKGRQTHRLTGKVPMDGEAVKTLLVDSDAKAVKENSMYEKASKRYEKGLASIQKGILTKGGIKQRDAVSRRLSKLDKQYGAIRLGYEVNFTYEGAGKKE